MKRTGIGFWGFLFLTAALLFGAASLLWLACLRMHLKSRSEVRP